MTAEQQEVLREKVWARLVAGVHWLREKNAVEFRALKADVRRDGGDPKVWEQTVIEASDNGLVVTPEREPKPGVQASL